MTTASMTIPDSRATDGNSAEKQLLLFTNGFMLFGLPSNQVLEILYPHSVTPIPFVSPAIDGLINVDGRIAVQVNLGTLSEFPSTNNRTELLLIDTGRALCALKVDSVLSRTAIPQSDFNNALPDNSPAALRELTNGSANWMGNTVILLDSARLGRLVRPEGLSDEGTGILGKVFTETTRTDNARTHCLVVEAAGERYALPLTHVVEIVAGGACTPVPGAPPAIKGLFLLRDTVLLVVDLAARLGLQNPDDNEKTDNNWYVVLDHERGRCAFAFEQLVEIEYFSDSNFQSANTPDSVIKGLFVGDNSNTLLLNTDVLVDEQIRAILASHHQNLSGQQHDTTEASLRFLHVEICGTSYVIPVEAVKRVTPCFPMERTQDQTGRIRGAIDLDGTIIPVLELAYGLSLPHAVPEKEFVVIGDDEQNWAIGVDNASRIISVPRTQLNQLARSDARYVGGVVQVDDQLLSLLDFSVLSAQNTDEGDH